MIKKSDVDGGVQKVIDDFKHVQTPEDWGHLCLKHEEAIKNALIAQTKDMEFRGKCRGCDQEIYIRNGFMESDPDTLGSEDTVTIPRKVLEEVATKQHELWERYLGGLNYYPNNGEAFLGCLEQAINEVLNYKEGDIDTEQ